VLTKKLCARSQKVATVEIDRSLEKVSEYVLKDTDNHTMIYGDFLRVPLEKPLSLLCGKVNAAGNLPYNITGEIIMRLIKNRQCFENAVVMIQKEAAQKLAAKDGKQYRAISVITQYFAEIETLFDVSPDCFIPAPHVDSRVIRLKFKKNTALDGMESEFSSFVHTLFSQRRKQLGSVLKNAPIDKNLRTLRAENLSPEQLADLFLLINGK
jgi:16S rRNA (adenine1518-N6/adenine1519-N6)-dimethyltransferase